MKKSYIVLTVLAMAALVSCQENEINYKPIGEDQVGFYLRGMKTTKADDASVTVRGVNIPLGTDDNGHQFFLEQTITNLDAMGPETKGTPAYTENVLSLYGQKFNATVYGANGLIESNGEFVYDEGLEKYVRKYDTDIWADAPLYFYLWMPGALNDAVGVSNLSFDAGKITFDYDGSKLPTAADQQDLLFTSRYFTGKGTGENEYNVKEGAEALFHHALTGVKFAISNPSSEDENIQITEIIINNLKDKGHCVITPTTEDGGYKDVSTTYSSASTSIWSGQQVSESSSYSSGTYGAPIDYTDGDFADSFFDGGNTRNLNDADATQTFWVVPQEIAEDVTITIKYKVGPLEGEWDLELGKYLSKSSSKITFQAGQLHTFYIKVDNVNVQISDNVTATQKSNVAIKNTGNTDAFIRAALIGQWLDDNNNPVFGFTDMISTYKEVKSWYDDQFGDGAGTHGTFVGLAGYKGASNLLNDWQLCSDGFYYYTKAVAPGATTGSNLFTSYTVGTPPTVEIAGVDTDIHFLLEISTQAISAKKTDTSTYTWQEAWTNALGYNPMTGPSGI